MSDRLIMYEGGYGSVNRRLLRTHSLITARQANSQVHSSHQLVQENLTYISLTGYLHNCNGLCVRWFITAVIILSCIDNKCQVRFLVRADIGR